MSQSDFVSRGQALVAAGQFQEAVKVCRLGLLGRPTTVEGRVVLGQALQTWEKHGKTWWMVDETRVKGYEMPGLQEALSKPEE